ncbi:uncharacterized protein L203_101808 [Cryptococcus depauperatus CBS 7841]|uniref:Uncharacterized protein n=1 Tax=Cryptococcus depauperatus CBS 7841 TaxID=1295531 RepID=A0A1E3IIS9_9TREE|nr:zinc knuckle family protein [Cryptococcus depauperatus CBS 7841]
MVRFTSIGMGRKKFVASAAEEARQAQESMTQSENQDAGPSTPNGVASNETKSKKKRRGRIRTRDETGKRIGIGEKKGPDDGKVMKRWGRDPDIARRSRISERHVEERRQRRFDERNASVTCFACRGVGHAARDCPNILLAASSVGAPTAEDDGRLSEGRVVKKSGDGRRKGGKKGGEVTTGKCYRCDSNEHSLHQCPNPVDLQNPTPFATCYICLGQGHLSSLCPTNTRGVYVNGGACKVCQSTAHRAKDCPEEKSQREGDVPIQRGKGEIVLGTGSGAGADEDDFMVEARHRPLPQQKSKNKRHPPARNGERPMKRVKNPGEDYAEQGEPVPATETLPLTARKREETGKSKPKAKVIAF